MRLNVVLIGAAVIMLILGVLIFLPKNTINNAIRDVSQEPEKTTPTNIVPQNPQTEQPTTGGSGSSSGSSSGSGSSETAQQCSYSQISYGITNIERTTTCNSYSGSVCVDKSVNCSITVHNLDDQTTGTFKIAFIYFEEGHQDPVINSQLLQAEIPHETSHHFEYVSHFQTQSETGAANKNLTCTYTTVEIPQRQYCVQ